jgi:sarcosine oxidase gamma subunit
MSRSSKLARLVATSAVLAGTAAGLVLVATPQTASAATTSAQIVVQRSGTWTGVGIRNLQHLAPGRWVVYTTATATSCLQLASLADSGRTGEIRAFGGVFTAGAVEVDEYDVNGNPQDQTFQLGDFC